MNLQRKVYATRGEKFVDLIIGVVLWHIVNIVLGIGFALVSGLVTGVANDPNVTNIMSIVSTVLGCLPFLVNIALLIFFGLTRHWIALGMLATFAVYIILTICALVVFGVACFSILGSSGSGL